MRLASLLIGGVVADAIGIRAVYYVGAVLLVAAALSRLTATHDGSRQNSRAGPSGDELSGRTASSTRQEWRLAQSSTFLTASACTIASPRLARCSQELHNAAGARCHWSVRVGASAWAAVHGVQDRIDDRRGAGSSWSPSP
jgi:hypothetical protein